MRAHAALLASWLRLEMMISSPGWKSKAVERLCRSWVEDIPIDICFLTQFDKEVILTWVLGLHTSSGLALINFATAL